MTMPGVAVAKQEIAPGVFVLNLDDAASDKEIAKHVARQIQLQDEENAIKEGRARRVPKSAVSGAGQGTHPRDPGGETRGANSPTAARPDATATKASDGAVESSLAAASSASGPAMNSHGNPRVDSDANGGGSAQGGEAARPRSTTLDYDKWGKISEEAERQVDGGGADARSGDGGAGSSDGGEHIVVPISEEERKEHLRLRSALACADAERERGNALLKSGDLVGAVHAYTCGLRYHPSALLLANRAEAYLRMGQWDKAECDCGRALSLDPSLYKAHVRRATARHALHRPVDAASDLRDALRLLARPGLSDKLGPRELSSLASSLGEVEAEVAAEARAEQLRGVLEGLRRVRKGTGLLVVADAVDALLAAAKDMKSQPSSPSPSSAAKSPPEIMAKRAMADLRRAFAELDERAALLNADDATSAATLDAPPASAGGATNVAAHDAGAASTPDAADSTGANTDSTSAAASSVIPSTGGHPDHGSRAAVDDGASKRDEGPGGMHKGTDARFDGADARFDGTDARDLFVLLGGVDALAGCYTADNLACLATLLAALEYPPPSVTGSSPWNSSSASGSSGSSGNVPCNLGSSGLESGGAGAAGKGQGNANPAEIKGKESGSAGGGSKPGTNGALKSGPSDSFKTGSDAGVSAGVGSGSKAGAGAGLKSGPTSASKAAAGAGAKGGSSAGFKAVKAGNDGGIKRVHAGVAAAMVGGDGSGHAFEVALSALVDRRMSAVQMAVEIVHALLRAPVVSSPGELLASLRFKFIMPSNVMSAVAGAWSGSGSPSPLSSSNAASMASPNGLGTNASDSSTITPFAESVPAPPLESLHPRGPNEGNDRSTPIRDGSSTPIPGSSTPIATTVAPNAATISITHVPGASASIMLSKAGGRRSIPERAVWGLSRSASGVCVQVLVRVFARGPTAMHERALSALLAAVTLPTHPLPQPSPQAQPHVAPPQDANAVMSLLHALCPDGRILPSLPEAFTRGLTSGSVTVRRDTVALILAMSREGLARTLAAPSPPSSLSGSSTPQYNSSPQSFGSSVPSSRSSSSSVSSGPSSIPSSAPLSISDPGIALLCELARDQVVARELLGALTREVAAYPVRSRMIGTKTEPVTDGGGGGGRGRGGGGSGADTENGEDAHVSIRSFERAERHSLGLMVGVLQCIAALPFAPGPVVAPQSGLVGQSGSQGDSQPKGSPGARAGPSSSSSSSSSSSVVPNAPTTAGQAFVAHALAIEGVPQALAGLLGPPEGALAGWAALAWEACLLSSDAPLMGAYGGMDRCGASSGLLGSAGLMGWAGVKGGAGVVGGAGLKTAAASMGGAAVKDGPQVMGSESQVDIPSVVFERSLGVGPVPPATAAAPPMVPVRSPQGPARDASEALSVLPGARLLLELASATLAGEVGTRGGRAPPPLAVADACAVALEMCSDCIPFLESVRDGVGVTRVAELLLRPGLPGPFGASGGNGASVGGHKSGGGGKSGGVGVEADGSSCQQLAAGAAMMTRVTKFDPHSRESLLKWSEAPALAESLVKFWYQLRRDGLGKSTSPGGSAGSSKVSTVGGCNKLGSGGASSGGVGGGNMGGRVGASDSNNKQTVSSNPPGKSTSSSSSSSSTSSSAKNDTAAAVVTWSPAHAIASRRRDYEQAATAALHDHIKSLLFVLCADAGVALALVERVGSARMRQLLSDLRVAAIASNNAPASHNASTSNGGLNGATSSPGGGGGGGTGVNGNDPGAGVGFNSSSAGLAALHDAAAREAALLERKVMEMESLGFTRKEAGSIASYLSTLLPSPPADRSSAAALCGAPVVVVDVAAATGLLTMELAHMLDDLGCGDNKVYALDEDLAWVAHIHRRAKRERMDHVVTPMASPRGAPLAVMLDRVPARVHAVIACLALGGGGSTAGKRGAAAGGPHGKEKGDRQLASEIKALVETFRGKLHPPRGHLVLVDTQPQVIEQVKAFVQDGANAGWVRIIAEPSHLLREGYCCLVVEVSAP
eukprot:jgi/Mesvir1/15724/Mv03301-RA.1